MGNELKKQVTELEGAIDEAKQAADSLKRKPGGGSKLSRSETVTVRLDPKLRYLAELASRKQRRTVSSFIEWAIEDSLNRIIIYDGTGHNGDDDLSIADQSSALWDVDEPDRFVKLASRYQELLTHDEQILWKLIRENGWLWRGNYNKSDEWAWTPHVNNIIFERLRDKWALFKAVADGTAEKDVLPSWEKSNPDTIPF
jgi:hypothetical protein